MANASLLFIPDISGFTKFVNETELNHSQHIISELLEVIIDSNELNLTVAEIEGDAILFFKPREVPGIQALVAQAKKMFVNFHNHLQLYQTQRICDCGACTSAAELTLKFVVHAGNDMQLIKVKDFEKPHGGDVILAHRLLKNTVDSNEYALFTQQLLNGSSPSTEWAEAATGQSEYDAIGKVDYSYISMERLHELVEPPSPKKLLKKSDNPVVCEIYIDKPVKDVFPIIVDFDHRLKWSDGLDSLEYNEKEINRVGSTHKCMVNNKLIEFETVTNNFGEDKLVYGERNVDPPLVREFTNYFIVSKQGKGTHIRNEFHYVPRPFLGRLVVPVFRLGVRKVMGKALKAIKEVCETD